MSETDIIHLIVNIAISASLVGFILGVMVAFLRGRD